MDFQNILVILVINNKMFKKVIKSFIRSRFINVFDKTSSEIVSLKDIILFGPYGIPITSNFKIIYSPLGTREFAEQRLL